MAPKNRIERTAARAEHNEKRFKFEQAQESLKDLKADYAAGKPIRPEPVRPPVELQEDNVLLAIDGGDANSVILTNEGGKATIIIAPSGHKGLAYCTGVVVAVGPGASFFDVTTGETKHMGMNAKLGDVVMIALNHRSSMMLLGYEYCWIKDANLIAVIQRADAVSYYAEAHEEGTGEEGETEAA